MAKRQEEEQKGGSPEWMSTYGDMVTLLLCFFVLLYAMSEVDVVKFQNLATALSGKPVVLLDAGGGDGITDMLGNGLIEMPIVEKTVRQDQEEYHQAQQELTQMASDFKTYFADQNLSEYVEVTQTEEYVKLHFKEGILFDLGRANLKPEAVTILDMVATELLKYPQNDIRIEGHADNTPISTPQFPTNYHLSAARSINVGLFFIEQKNMDPFRIETAAMGEYRPIAPNDTSENKAKNRRVEIKILSQYFSGSSQI